MPRNPSGSAEPRAHSAQPAPKRYSPELPWRPVVSPPSVEDRDACAIYASVRKDATPSHEPVALALRNLQKMLHRAGNVDGEGDGCGVLVDIPRKIWLVMTPELPRAPINAPNEMAAAIRSAGSPATRSASSSAARVAGWASLRRPNGSPVAPSAW